MSTAPVRAQGSTNVKANKSDFGILKKYRPLVPASLPDAALLTLVKRCDNNDSLIGAEIQSLWDKETETRQEEAEEWIVEKKKKKVDPPPAPAFDRRGDRGRGGPAAGRGGGREAGRGRNTGGRGGRGSDRPIPIKTASPETAAVAAPVVENPAVENIAPTKGPINNVNKPESEESVLVVSIQNVQISALPAIPAVVGGSAWGAGSLAQKIKSAEKAAIEQQLLAAAAAAAAALQLAEESVQPAPHEAKQQQGVAKESPSKKTRPKKEKKNNKKVDSSAVVEVPETIEVVVIEVPEPESVVTVETIPELAASAEVFVPEKQAAAVVVPLEALVHHQQQQPTNEPHMSPSRGAANAPFVKLGKWDTIEPTVEAGFQFGNFDAHSNPSPVNNKQPSPKVNAKHAWKHEKKHNHVNHNADAQNWAASNGDFNNSSAGYQQIQTNNAIGVSGINAASPPGLVLESGKATQQQNHGNRSNGQNKKSENDFHSGSRQQQSAPPGMNPRGAAAGGFGAMMPPYGMMPYDLSLQAPTLLHNGAYGVVQPAYPAAVTSPAAAATPVANGSAAVAAASSSQGATAPTAAATAPHQQYQQAPPGMHQQYMSYYYPGYNPQYYYGGQPQGYYRGGQPMYQPPPRNMYQAEGYGAGAPAIGGYPGDVYGAQNGQFGDASLYGNVPLHHHNQVPHPQSGGGKGQKNANNAAATQQQPPSTTQQQETHSGYSGYGGSYASRDQGLQQWPQYGSWTGPGPMVYSVGGPAGFNQSSSRHDNSTRGASAAANLNPPGYGTTTPGPYAAGARGPSGASGAQSAGPASGTAGGSNLQSTSW